MIGNSKWFGIRKYTGWGLTPNCWQGWAYIGAFLVPVILINSTTLNQNTKNLITAIWTGILLIDVVHIMSQIKKDEREMLHEAIADRNALWFMISVLVISVLVKQSVDPIFLIAILGATLIKAITQFYLRDK